MSGSAKHWLSLSGARGRTSASVLSDRRGATAVAFGVVAVVVIGFAGLATEAGRWYDVRRDMQDVADMAAIAAATRHQQVTQLSRPGGTLQGQGGTAGDQAIASARDVGRANAPSSDTAYFTSAMDVTFPTSSPGMPSGTYVKVDITRNERRLISSLFMAGSQQQIVVSSTAGVFTSGTACVLALGVGPSNPDVGLRIQGNTTNDSDTCVYASNALGANSININGTPTLNIAGLYSAGGCNTCGRYDTGGANALANGVDTGQPAIPDPFDYLNNILTPTKVATLDLSQHAANQRPCAGVPNNTVCNWTVDPTWMRQDATIGPYYVFTSDLVIGSGNGPQNVTLANGTYLFDGGGASKVASALRMTGGTLTCGSCTLIFLNAWKQGQGVSFDTAGTVSINGNATINLNAPTSGAFAGVLLWRMGKSDGSSEASGNGFGNAEVSIEGTVNSRLGGGVYVPRADLSWNGDSSMTAISDCLVLVAGSITLSGNNRTTGTSSEGCAAYNSGIVPRAMRVRLIN